MIWIKRLAFLLLFLLALVIGFIGYVLLFIDPNDFKKELVSIADKQANIDLTIDGDISWSFFPWLGVELNGIGVAAKGQPELVRFKEAEFRVAVVPLLQKKIEVETVRLIGLEAELEIDPEGKGNWTFSSDAVVQTSETQSEVVVVAPFDSQQQPTVESEKTQTFKIPEINIAKIELVDAQVHFVDETSGLDITARANADISDVAWGKSWPLVFELQLDALLPNGQDSSKLRLELSASLGADLAVFPERQSLSLSNLNLQTRSNSELLPVSPMNASIQVQQLELDIPQENLFVEALSLNALGVSLESQIKAYEILSKPKFSVVADVGEFSPRELLSRLNVTLPKMADESTLSSLRLNMTIDGDLESVKVQPISLVLDDTQVEANANLKLNPLSWSMSVAGSDLNIDRYLPPVEEEKASSTVEVENGGAVESNASSVETELIPVDMVRTLNGSVDFVFQNIKAKNLSIDKVSATSLQSNGLVTLNPMVVEMYEGNATLDATLDARSDTPKIAISPQVNGIQIYPLLNDFMELDKVRGTTQLTGDLYTSGNNVDELMAQLNGDLLVEIKDGALIGMNLTKSVCEGIASTRSGKKVNDTAFGEDTPFEMLSFPAHVDQGVVSTPDLKIKAVGIGVTGDGQVSLPEQTINYQADVSIIGSDIDSSCEIKRVYRSLAFPIVCQGEFNSDPATLCRPDIKGFGRLFEKVAKQELEAQKAKIEAEAKAKLKAKQAKLEAEAKAKLEAEKARLKEKQKAKEEELKKKLENELKDSLKGLFG